MGKHRYQKKYLKKKKAVLAILFALFFTIQSTAQKAIRYSIESGLPDVSCISLYSDKSGLLWIGTQAGLVVYNGSEFECIKHGSKKEGTIGRIIVQICPEKSGSFFLSTVGLQGENFKEHLELYNPRTNHSVEINLKKNGAIVDSKAEKWMDLYVDTSNNLWLLSSAGRIMRYNHATKDTVSFNVKEFVKDSISIISNFQLVSLQNKTLLSYCSDKGFMPLKSKKSEQKFYPLANEIISGALGDSTFFWVFTMSDNVYQFDPVKNKYAFKFSGIRGLRPKVMNGVKKKNDLYLASFLGIIKLNTIDGSSQIISNDPADDNTISSNLVNSLIFDSENNLWAGTLQNGLNCIINKADKFNFIPLNTKEGSPIEVYHGIQDGTNWILASSEGLISYNTIKKNYSVLIPLPDQLRYVENSLRSASMIKDMNGDIWYGGYSFLFVYNPQKKTTRNFSGEKLKGVTILKVSGFEQAQKNEMWMAIVGGGVVRYNYEKDEVKIYDSEHGLNEPQNRVFQLETVNGRIFASTNTQGVLEYDKKRDSWVKLPFKDNATTLDMKWIDGKLWVGSYFNKIIEVDASGKNVLHTFPSGKPDVYGIKSMVLDSKKNIWFSSLKGIGEFNMKTKKYSFIDDAESIPFLEFNYAFEICTGDNGAMMVGQPNGFVLWDENVFDARVPVPVLFLTQVEIDEKPLERGKVRSIPFLKNNFDLAWYENDLGIAFSSLQMQNYHGTFYRYRLLGLNYKWINCGAQQKVNYSGLNPGDYVFEVCASVNGVDWSKPVKLSFTISPPWWKTWWFIFTELFMAILAVILFLRWRTAALREKQRQLEHTVMERTAEIREKQKEITDSINYAKRIQFSLLAHDELLQQNIPQHFVLFQPKDIVSGDFYWATRVSDARFAGNNAVPGTMQKTNEFAESRNNAPHTFYLAVCDSTGHGVPGAFMSLLNISFLNEAINEKGIDMPNEVFNHVRQRLTVSMEGAKDGMDATLVKFSGNKLVYASANNKPVLVRNNELVELNADKMPVGKADKTDSFRLYELEVQKGDCLYFYTDGYADQFGGEKGKKFKYKNLNNLLLQVHTLSLSQQKERLEHEFLKWKGDLEQVDDVCVIGIRI